MKERALLTKLGKITPQPPQPLFFSLSTFPDLPSLFSHIFYPPRWILMPCVALSFNIIQMKLILSLSLLLVLLSAEVLPFDNSAIDKIFQQKKSALFLFLGDETAQSSSLDAFKAYDQTNPDLILTLSTRNDGHGLFDRLAEYLGVNTQDTPQVLYLNANAEKFRFEGEISADSLATFVGKVNSGEIEAFLKSAPIPEDNNEPVKVVVGKNFKEVVLNSEQEVLVKFYAPWCGHCKHLAPHYDEAARRIANNPNILLVKVDSTENEVSGVDIQGFPTLKFWGKDKSAEPLEYNGGRDADGIVAWLKEHTQYEWVEPLSGEEPAEAAEEQL